MERDSVKKWKLLCNDELNYKRDALKPLEEIADIDYQEARYDLLLESIERYDAYFASAHVKTDRTVLEKAKRLKVIGTPSTGTDHIDVEFAKKKNIVILDIAKEFELLDTFSATAEMAWCLLLSLIRHLPQAFESAKKGHWARQKFSGVQLLGKTIGILGYGRLGKMVAEMAKGFRMNVITCDIQEINTPGIRQVDFDTLLSKSDIVSIHIHLTKENRGLFSRDVFSKIKKGVIIINTSRGAIIDEEALLDALNSGIVAGAGLDVINGEWNNNLLEHPLIKYVQSHDNLIISPHIGGATVESIVGAREFMAYSLLDYLKSIS